MLNQTGGSRTDTLIKLVLVFFLSLLSFSVGTFVGKQFSDSQHKIADLENNGEEERSTASIPADAAKVEPSNAISEEEISKLSDEFVKKEKLEGSPAHDSATAKNEGSNGLTGTAVGEEKKANAKKKDQAANAAKKTNTVRDEIADISKRIAAGEKVVPPKVKPSRIPSSLPRNLASSVVGKYTIQISAHASEDEAKSKTQQLIDKGLSAFYVPAAVNGKTWYRVSVGQYDDAKAAKLARADVAKKAGAQSAIVQKIGK
jgi:septal ring-binding cell division protein DamX